MSRRASPHPDLPPHPFSARQVRKKVTRGQLRSSAYIRLGRGVFCSADIDVDFGTRIRAARVGLPDSAVLCSLAAAWAWTVRHAEADDPVVANLLPKGSARSRPGVVIRAQNLPTEQVMRRPLGLVTSPDRTAVDLLRDLPADRSVPAVDELLKVTSTRVGDVAALLEAVGGRGVVRARKSLPLLDPQSESPRESLLRMLIVQAGLPRPVSQYEVRDERGRFVARLDLAWPDLKVAVEYDGAHHRERSQHSMDLKRHNALRAAGWVVIQVDADVFAEPAALLAQLRGLVAGRTAR